MALSLVKTITKVGLSGGAIYWSIEQGVWGTTQEGSQAMRRFAANILPQESNEPRPVVNVNDNWIKSSWNNGTKLVFEYFRDIPEFAGKAMDSTAKLVADTFGK